MNDTMQIGRACFIGGAICGLVALLATPAFWWFGIFAGAAGGYIAHEFRAVLKAIPRAFRESQSHATRIVDNWSTRTRDFFAVDHPILYTSIAISVTLVAINEVFLPISKEISLVDIGMRLLIGSSFGYSFGLLFLLMGVVEVAWGSVAITAALLATLARIGSRKIERVFWPLFFGPEEARDEETEALLAKGLRMKPLTYRNFLRWVASRKDIALSYFG